jgi:hypothetical protein
VRGGQKKKKKKKKKGEKGVKQVVKREVDTKLFKLRSHDLQDRKLK